MPTGSGLLPCRAHTLNGAGQQTTARRHRGLLPAVSVRLVLEAQACTPSCHPQQALCAAVRATHPVQSTGKGRRAESRSVSDPEPESLAAAPCPRRVRPVSSAGPRATIHHRVLTGKKSFEFLPQPQFVSASILQSLRLYRMPSATGCWATLRQTSSLGCFITCA